jgi:hypothetical protein
LAVAADLAALTIVARASCKAQWRCCVSKRGSRPLAAAKIMGAVGHGG